jgi:hypothetical protein
MFSLELECQNVGCLYKHPHMEQSQKKYMRRIIDNLNTLGHMETTNLKYCHI